MIKFSGFFFVFKVCHYESIFITTEHNEGSAKRPRPECPIIALHSSLTTDHKSADNHMKQ